MEKNEFNFPLLKKITIIIFSYNRHKYLVSTIKYWSRYGVKVLVLDGSDTILNDPCLKVNNVKYVYDPRGVYDRLLSSTNFIDTEFMILSPDDEFYIPSALSSCIDFLIKNPSFSSCGGHGIGFGLSDFKKLTGKELYKNLKNYALDHDDASERIKKHFLNYQPTHIYSLMRSSHWREICHYVFKKEYSFYSNYELQVEFLIMFSGKSKIIPNLMWMRNFILTPVAEVNPNLEPNLPIKKWWYNKNFKIEKLDFLERMKKACEQLSHNQSQQLSKNQIVKLFEFYIHGNFLNRYFFSPIRNIINVLPPQIKRIIRFFISRKNIIINKNKILDKSIFDQAKRLESKGVKVDYKNLNYAVTIIESLFANKN